MKTKRVSIDHAIDLYYNRHKAELDNVFGDERAAKSHLKYDTPDMPASYFSDYAHAAERMGDYVEALKDPYKADLAKAKRDAINRDIWGDQRKLNKRIDAGTFMPSGSYLGIDPDGWDEEVEGYYDVKNSTLVLAHIRVYNGSSEFFKWEYIDRSLL